MDHPDFTWLDQRIQYVVYQVEKGEHGTMHLQGYLVMEKVTRIKGIKAINGMAHWETRKGNHKQARDYCVKKDKTYVAGPWEFGNKPNQKKRNDIEQAVADIKKNNSWPEMIDNHPKLMVRCTRGMLFVKQALAEPRDHKTEVYWYHGATGTGKSKKVHEDYPDAYWKDMSNGKWWDGYEGHETVVFDDMRKDTFKFHELLRIFDRYPLRVEVKGGFTEFRALKIYVTSCYSWHEMYETREDLGQLARRITETVHFNEPLVVPAGEVEQT